jgi:hypothetical protein
VVSVPTFSDPIRRVRIPRRGGTQTCPARRVEHVLLVLRLVAVLSCSVLALTACTDSAPPDGPATTLAGSEGSPSPSERVLTARERAAQLTALAPTVFDANYRLEARGKRPDAMVRMRTKGDKFRLDVERGRTTAVLFTSRRGVVSCQIEDAKKGKTQRACFLVAKHLNGLPTIFDPQVQRLFRSTTDRIARNRKALTIKRAPPWRAPAPYGPAECFRVRGLQVDRGTYCYLAKPGPLIGLLARVEFPSGTLSLRTVNRSVRAQTFQPPVRPTPIPK